MTNQELKQAIAMGIGDLRVQLVDGPGINLEQDAAINDKLSEIMQMVTDGDFDYYAEIIKGMHNQECKAS